MVLFFHLHLIISHHLLALIIHHEMRQRNVLSGLAPKEGLQQNLCLDME